MYRDLIQTLENLNLVTENASQFLQVNHYTINNSMILTNIDGHAYKKPFATRPIIVKRCDAESTPSDECPNKGDRYHCRICKIKFNKHGWFQKHITTHAPHKINSCKICNKKLSSQKSVKRHREIHNTRRKSYKCKMCKSSFLQKSDLNYHHKTIHIKHELIKCLHCTKTYATQKQLKMHNNDIHLHLKSYKCPLCELSFRMSIAFFRHRRKVHKNNNDLQF